MSNSPFNCRYSSLINFATKGECEISLNSRRVVEAMKYDRQGIIDKIALRVAENCQAGGIFSSFFGNSSWLVPVPGSTVRVKGGLWIGLRLCEALQAQKLGAGILEIIERTETIRSARFSGLGNRPTIETHLASLKCSRANQISISHITLVDDVITKGSTIIACALKLREIYPNAEICAFGAARTLGFVASLEKLKEPYEAQILYDGQTARRE